MDAGLRLELSYHPFNHSLIEILASEKTVSTRREHLEYAVAQLQDRDVEGAAPQIEDCNPFFLLFPDTIGQRSRSRLVYDPSHFQSRDSACILGRLALRIVEIRGDGDDRLLDLFPQEVLGHVLEILQKHGR